mmetsp:Transcript_266/g.544  ORF Transcript_266/g.544 Transcript_266/m.544 type:complete len:395 (-) Transcript_266:695-1879(-)
MPTPMSISSPPNTSVAANESSVDPPRPAPSGATDSIAAAAAVARAHITKSRAFIAATEYRCKKKVASFVRFHLERKKIIKKASGTDSDFNTAPSSPAVRDRDLPEAAALAAQALISMASSDALPLLTVDAPPNATLLDVAELALRHVWHVEKMRDAQRDCIEFIYDPSKNKRACIVLPTAFRKSHVIRLVGTLSKGVHVVMYPLLASTADQVAAFTGGNEAYGFIVVINFDIHASTCGAVRRKIIANLIKLKRSTTTTYFLFGSPQFFALNQDFVDALLQCNDNERTLCSVSCDEAHLLAQHGSSFRSEIRKIGKTLFTPLFPPANAHRPIMIALTATMSLEDLATFSKLTTVEFPPERNRLWASPDQFAQEHISIQLKITSEFTKNLMSQSTI